MSNGRTLYHVIFAELLKERAPPGIRVFPEFVLATEPQRADILLLRQEGTERRDEEARTLRRLWPLLPGDTLVEYKSPSRPVRRGDIARLLGYGAQYHSMNAERLLDRTDLALVMVVPSLTPTLDNELAALGWIRQPIGDGYYRLNSRPYPGIVVVTDEVSEAERDELLDLVGHRKMESDVADAWIVEHTLYGPEAVAMEKMEGYEEVMKKALARMSVRTRLLGLTPEQRVEGMSPEQQVLALNIEVLRGFTPEYIASLPADVRDEVRRRLAIH